MVTYTVYQDGKPCSSYKIPTWDQDTFNTFEEAKSFMIRWAYPVYPGDDLYEYHMKRSFQPDTDYDLSMANGYELIMRIVTNTKGERE